MSAPSSDTRGPLLALAAMGSLTLALGVVWLAVDVGAPDVGQSRPGIGDNPLGSPSLWEVHRGWSSCQSAEVKEVRVGPGGRAGSAGGAELADGTLLKTPGSISYGPLSRNGTPRVPRTQGSNRPTGAEHPGFVPKTLQFG
jgi:hypothetical protein